MQHDLQTIAEQAGARSPEQARAEIDARQEAGTVAQLAAYWDELKAFDWNYQDTDDYSRWRRENETLDRLRSKARVMPAFQALFDVFAAHGGDWQRNEAYRKPGTPPDAAASDAALEWSGVVTVALNSTEAGTRIAKLAQLREAEVAADKAHAVFYPKPAFSDEEAEVRYEAARLRACRVFIAAKEAFVEAARAFADHCRETLTDPRDSHPAREGIFRDHNCSRCQDGAKPCVQGGAHRCEYPHARND